MDIATLVGMLGGFGIIAAAMILGGGIGMFINAPSLLIVLLGSALIVLVKYGLGQFLGAVKVGMKAVFFKPVLVNDLIEKAVQLADAARKGGLLSLEGMEIPDPFMKKGVGLLVDGHEPDVVRKMLSKEMNLTVERHSLGQRIFKDLGDVSPAMGMIGTLVGLVQMLSAMDDPRSIGPAMAVALLTTLYGAMVANMFAIPIADKLALRSDEERQSKSLVIDALIGIQAGQNPRVIQSTLQTYLPSSKRPIEDGDG